MNEKYNDTFFVNLLSKDSVEFHQENNESNFINQFDKHIELNRKMEVALFQLSLPKICNIPELSFSLVVKENYIEKVLTEKIFRQNYVTDEDKLTELFNSLCQTTNEELKTLLESYHTLKQRSNVIYKAEFDTPKIYFVNNTAYYTVFKIRFDAEMTMHREVKNRLIEVYWKIDNYLENLFDFKTVLKDSIVNLEEIKTNTEQKKFIPFINHINVCSDIIETSLVGNMKLNLLRIISKSKLDKNDNSINFNPLIFVPVRKNLIDSINICLIDDKKKYIVLDKGLTTAVLLFRPIEHI